MSDITTPGAVHAAVGDMLAVELLGPTRFDTMQSGLPIYILVKGRHATTDDGRHVRFMVHQEMVDFEQSTADEQQCLVEPYDDDGKPTAEPYFEKYGKLTLRLEPYEQNIISLAVVQGVLSIPGDSPTMSITHHIRREVLDLRCLQLELTHLTGKSYEGMCGEKAYTIVIDMGKTMDSKLREMSQHFAQAMSYDADVETNRKHGAEMLASMAEKFEGGTSSKQREELLFDLNRVVELRVVGKKNF